MQPCIGYIEFWRMFVRSARKGFEVGTGRGIGDADDLDAVRQKRGLEVEITGIIDQNRISRLQKVAADEIERLRAGIGQQYFSTRNVDPLFAKPMCQMLAHGPEAQRFA